MLCCRQVVQLQAAASAAGALKVQLAQAEHKHADGAKLRDQVQVGSTCDCYELIHRRSSSQGPVRPSAQHTAAGRGSSFSIGRPFVLCLDLLCNLSSGDHCVLLVQYTVFQSSGIHGSLQA
jgi:hypothetical protein